MSPRRKLHLDWQFLFFSATYSAWHLHSQQVTKSARNLFVGYTACLESHLFWTKQTAWNLESLLAKHTARSSFLSTIQVAWNLPSLWTTLPARNLQFLLAEQSAWILVLSAT